MAGERPPILTPLVTPLKVKFCEQNLDGAVNDILKAVRVMRVTTLYTYYHIKHITVLTTYL